MFWVRNVFLKYGLGAERLSKIWFGCETSSWTMKTGAKRLSYLWGGGETSFLSMSWGRNVSLKNGANWLWGGTSVYPFRRESIVYRRVDLRVTFNTTKLEFKTLVNSWRYNNCFITQIVFFINTCLGNSYNDMTNVIYKMMFPGHFCNTRHDKRVFNNN